MGEVRARRFQRCPAAEGVMTAEVSRPRGRIAVRTAAITAFGLALVLGVASLPLAGLAGQAAGNDTGSNVAVAVRYDADQTVAAFAARLKDAVDLDSVRDDLTGVVHQALAPAHASLWISHHG